MAEIGIPPTDATEKDPDRVCSEPSSGERTWIIVCAEADKDFGLRCRVGRRLEGRQCTAPTGRGDGRGADVRGKIKGEIVDLANFDRVKRHWQTHLNFSAADEPDPASLAA